MAGTVAAHTRVMVLVQDHAVRQHAIVHATPRKRNVSALLQPPRLVTLVPAPDGNHTHSPTLPVMPFAARFRVRKMGGYLAVTPIADQSSARTGAAAGRSPAHRRGLSWLGALTAATSIALLLLALTAGSGGVDLTDRLHHAVGSQGVSRVVLSSRSGQVTITDASRRVLVVGREDGFISKSGRQFAVVQVNAHDSEGLLSLTAIVVAILSCLFVGGVLWTAWRSRGPHVATAADHGIGDASLTPSDDAGADERRVNDQAPTDSPARDSSDLLGNPAWMSLVQENVAVVDELEHHASSLDSSARAIADHATALICEALERADVELIADDKRFDARRHSPLDKTGRIPLGTPIVETVSPGFAVGKRVLRRASVRVST
jgi:hypothetical protein